MPSSEAPQLPDDIAAFRGVLGAPPGAPNPSPVSPVTLDNVAFHDFAFYRFLLDPAAAYGRQLPDISDRAAAYLDALENGGATTEALDYMANFLLTLETILDGAVRDSRLDQARQDNFIDTILASLYEEHSYYIGRMLALATDRANFLEIYVYGEIRDAASAYEAYGTAFSWTDLFLTYWAPLLELPRSRRELQYPFEAFPNYSTNVGIRVVYRQEWKPLGTQPGEIVRTIPLGPGQKERVTTKIIRRQKRTSTLEQATERETTTETSDTVKDSSEVVEEAAGSQNWNVNTEISGSYGFVSGSVSAGAGGTSQDTSRDTSSTLSESMRKAASKLRHSTKVVVATESEENFEQERFSEIVNANNEIAVTYKFHKLQHQYEVFTYLAEVHAVIFVAEHLPSTIEVNAAWVRRHDWILIKVLKDESFRQSLNELIQDADDGDLGGGANRFEGMLSTAQSSFGQFTTNGTGPGQGGLSIPDIYAEPQRQYGQYARDSAARSRSNEIRRARRERLFQHFRDNILHYCRAIWLAEDPDQRMLRYRKENRRVAFEWRGPLVPTVAGQAQAPIEFTPTGVDAPLWEVIEPTGPIAFVGNYAVFKLRALGSASNSSDSSLGTRRDDLGVLVAGLSRGEIVLRLDHVLAEMRREFVRNGRLHDPAFDGFLDEARRDMRANPQRFAALEDDEIEDLLSYLPHLWSALKDAAGATRRNLDGTLVRAPSETEWAQYLHKKNATRRFLVDSNNLYLSLHMGEGTTLETFKLAHRYVDVLKAQEELQAERLRNLRRQTHLGQPGQYDPDVEKVVVVTPDPLAAGAAAAAAHAGGSQPAPAAPAAPPGGGGG